jgi:hypothetical protein
MLLAVALVLTALSLGVVLSRFSVLVLLPFVWLEVTFYPVSTRHAVEISVSLDPLAYASAVESKSHYTALRR